MADLRGLMQDKSIQDQSEVKLPGFGLPLDHERSESPYPSKLFDIWSFWEPLRTVDEYRMMDFMNRITDEPDWQRKVFDDSFVWRRRKEIVKCRVEDGEGENAARRERSASRFSTPMFDQSIAELRYKASLSTITNSIEALDGVFKSDTAISEEIRLALRIAVSALEQAPDREKDWSPGSNKQVLNFVDPSILPLVYGQTRVLPAGKAALHDCVVRCGEGLTLPEPELAMPAPNTFPFSKRFQWLPSNFDVPLQADEVRLTSYINNLHPTRHSKLYDLVEKIVAGAISLWNQTLTCAISERPARIELRGYGLRKTRPRPEWDDDLSWDENSDRLDAWYDSFEVDFPEPDVFVEPLPSADPSHPCFDCVTTESGNRLKAINLRSEHDGQLQIVVKMTSIELDPQRPEYPGESWHVEGQRNERICATAVYCFSCENINDAYIGFRQNIDHPEFCVKYLFATDIEQQAAKAIYGVTWNDLSMQELGRVLISQGRILTFPNMMQNCVGPISLADATRPGHCKMLTLFLVDPHQTLLSTANVPCQQKAWWDEIVREIGPLGTTLPPEITEYILKLADEFPISLHAAKIQREELIEEMRKNTSQP